MILHSLFEASKPCMFATLSEHSIFGSFLALSKEYKIV
jgi:hypothetical protein